MRPMKGGTPDNASTTSADAVLTHHWLVRRRGGERVLEALREMFPHAPIFTLVHDPRGYPVTGAPVYTSWLQTIPASSRHYPKLLPLMPMAARALQLPETPLVLCSDAAIAKAMTPHPDSRVVCYCHSPVRYVWDLCDVYRASLPLPLRPFWGTVARQIRRADAEAARRVDYFIANSKHVAERIQRAYGRESTVIYPPVDIPETPPSDARDDYYLCLGHHVAYKRLDLAVDACLKLRRRLVVVGEGPDVALQRRRAAMQGAGDLIQFLERQTDEQVKQHYQQARALLFPGEEDFGIVPVEAFAHGCPVIAYGVGGALETVEAGLTGLFFDEPDAEALAAAIRRFEQQSFDPRGMHERARRFSQPRFVREISDFLRNSGLPSGVAPAAR